MLDAKSLLETFGVLGLFGIIFAETGLLVGFFLPGDSLLVLAGLVAAVGKDSNLNLEINLVVVLVGVFVAAVLGAQVGYLIGRTAGPNGTNRPPSLSRCLTRRACSRRSVFSVCSQSCSPRPGC